MRLFNRQRTLEMLAPAAGTVIDLADVPDPVFAQAVLGPGFAVTPVDGVVVAPVAGTVAGVLPSRHAVYLDAADGVQVLVHVGLDTVKLAGRHFTMLVEAGDEVRAGQPIIEWQVDAVAAEGFETHIPVCLVELGPFKAVDVHTGIDVAAGQIAAVATRAER